ncbi:MAG: hypothetical protein Q9183_004945, partial [Haloplaca sp. 2 TL-2023]
ELRDTYLPFETEPKCFPKSGTQNLFELFQVQQWQFCAVPLEYEMSDKFGDDSILPVTDKEEIASGGSAFLYKITVDEAYNELKPADDAKTEAKSRSPNIFALKTYRRSPDAQEYFENERKGFIQLRYGDRPPANIIEYYGSFIRGETYNILLEYADLGTLDDYMEKVAEPKTDNEIGAPETYRSRDLETCHLQVDRSADIWALGCVVSEVATWVTGGRLKVSEFRRRRQKELAEILGVASSEKDRFHDGLEILQTVKTCYEDIAYTSRRCDLITPRVIEKIVKAMVRPYPESRGAARFLLDTSNQILEDAKGKGKGKGKGVMPSSPATNPNHAILESESSVQVRGPRLPPSLPPHLASKPQLIVEAGSSNPDAEQARVLRGSSTTRGQASSRRGQRSSVAKPSEEGSRRTSQEGCVGNDPEARGVEPRTGRLPHAPNDGSKSLIAVGPKPAPKSQLPTMTISEGLSVKREKKHSPAKYPGEDAFRESEDILKNRDHVILIDNGESMGQYRKEVEEVLELLATLTKRYDPNGLDLYFSTKSTKLRPKTPEKCLKYLDERPAKGIPDFRQRFATIIETYTSRFGKHNYARFDKYMHPTSTPSRGPRPLNLYVLTDGIWDPKCDLITEVTSLVASLIKHEMPNNDAVDTTPASGNVWKMLMGAVNDWYDDDEGSDDDENGDDDDDDDVDAHAMAPRQ